MATRIESVAVVHGSRLHHSARKLADHAVSDAVAAASIEPADVDLLVNVGLFHDRMLAEPALAALIQEDVGANPEDPHGEGHGTFSFDVANGSAGVLNALQIADGFLRSGTIRHAVIVAGDADPGHGMAPDFPYDPVGAALVCGWSSSESGLAGFRWTTVADAPARRDAVVRLEHGRNQLLLHEDDTFAAEAAACAGRVAEELLNDHGLQPSDVTAVAAAPFNQSFIDELVPRLGITPDRFARPEPRHRSTRRVSSLRSEGHRPRCQALRTRPRVSAATSKPSRRPAGVDDHLHDHVTFSLPWRPTTRRSPRSPHFPVVTTPATSCRSATHGVGESLDRRTSRGSRSGAVATVTDSMIGRGDPIP